MEVPMHTSKARTVYYSIIMSVESKLHAPEAQLNLIKVWRHGKTWATEEVPGQRVSNLTIHSVITHMPMITHATGEASCDLRLENVRGMVKDDLANHAVVWANVSFYHATLTSRWFTGHPQGPDLLPTHQSPLTTYPLVAIYSYIQFCGKYDVSFHFLTIGGKKLWEMCFTTVVTVSWVVHMLIALSAFCLIWLSRGQEILFWIVFLEKIHLVLAVPRF